MSDSNQKRNEGASREARTGALTPEEIRRNFQEIKPPLTDEDALQEARRCLYCEYDIPCMRGCPTRIDIPGFIRQIAEGAPEKAARTIFESNILGGVCARVCPVEKLCECLCICATLHGKPIPIGRLQRHATDRLMQSGKLPFTRSAPSGKRVAVIGAGPAGVSAAFELARLGHDVAIFEKEAEPGGLDRYGIAEYKIGAPFVRQELQYLLQIGGIEVRTNRDPVNAAVLKVLLKEYDAVVLGIGLGATRNLGIPGEGARGVVEALAFIRAIKTMPLHLVPVGRRVIVIGAGNTAVDAATQAKRLGAEEVIIAYRGDRQHAKCTEREFDLSVADGCRWVWNAEPVEILEKDGEVRAVCFRNRGPDCGESLVLECDQVIKSIGQEPHYWLKEVEGLELESNFTIKVDPIAWMTSVPGLFAAGDCVKKAKEVVNAVYEGKRAAISIDGFMSLR
jgi:dihydropyrimidine dehydrogenase (NAD+) subunit PreT